ncbi:recombinase family protein [Streptomyces scopuliridis]|uniref:Recombinase family protein n=1 Tax=Streptomyces scopuliridis TaxID=452529 RepID=A0ACD4ZRZ7_9ACTN|nr:recombinase family protein [Streptomyces scopuliridis]WSC00797.1 recombinase family protein [Streptomyces scopuliridis]WSC05592.1 recombinase family protein [Streptomyces scopuliridis]
MEREDLPSLRALGFEEAELRELDLWEPASGTPANVAEMYVRRSKKKDTLSTLREQVRRICSHAAAEGKRIRRVWFEQKSASKAYVRREEFEKATAAITKSGLSKTLYVYKTSRLSRRGMGQVGLLLDKFEEKSARIYVVAEHIDSTKQRMILAILSEQAREQVTDLSEFVKLGIDAHKAEGKWTGGVTPFGLRTAGGRLEHDPAEYPLARRIAEYLLDRKTPHWIANKLNSEGKLTRHGKKWSGPGIIALAHAVTWAGLVAQRDRALDENGKWTGKYHRGGTPLLDKKGNPISCGEGVITFAEHVKINAILASRAQKGTSIGDRTRGKREIVALLTGTLLCGLCNGAMANGGVNYRCYARQVEGEHSCKGVSTERARIEAAVEVMWLNHILSLSPDSPTIRAIAREWLSYQDPEKEARKTHVTAALESAVGREMKLEKEFFVMGRMDEDKYDSLRDQVAAQITELKAELAELSEEADLTPLMDPASLAGLWQGAGIGGQRALLKAAAKGITLLPSKYRGDRTPIFDRLNPEWRDDRVHPAEEAAWDRWEERRTQATV